MEDSRIIDLYWARSQQAISESELKYGSYCRTVSANILPRTEDVEECVNDTWLRAWNAMPPQRPDVLQAFFGKLVRNLSLDRWRSLHAAKRGGSQVEVALVELEDCLPGGNQVDDALNAAETAAVISRFLRTLPDTDRRLFVRRYWHLDSTQALRHQFRLSEGQIKSRLHRIRQRLRTALEQEGICV